MENPMNQAISKESFASLIKDEGTYGNQSIDITSSTAKVTALICAITTLSLAILHTLSAYLVIKPELIKAITIIAASSGAIAAVAAIITMTYVGRLVWTYYRMISARKKNSVV